MLVLKAESSQQQSMDLTKGRRTRNQGIVQSSRYPELQCFYHRFLVSTTVTEFMQRRAHSYHDSDRDDEWELKQLFIITFSSAISFGREI
jgi:hypothetical protein